MKIYGGDGKYYTTKYEIGDIVKYVGRSTVIYRSDKLPDFDILGWRQFKDGTYEYEFLMPNPLEGKQLKIVDAGVNIVQWTPSYRVECDGVILYWAGILEEDLEYYDKSR